MKNEERRSTLMTEERRQQILQILERDGRVFATDLSHRYQVSDDTIRRDLDALAEAGKLLRVHGGALRQTSFIENFAERQGAETTAKDAVARGTVSLLHSGQVIVLDGGTTSMAIVRHLPSDFAGTVITTSPPIATALAAIAGIEIILVGGRLYRYAMVAVGAETVANLQTIHADICIIGVLAVHPTWGLSVRDYEEAQVKRAMIATAPLVIAPTIREKLGTVAAFAVAPVSAITHLVTEASVTPEQLLPYQESGMTTLQV